MRIERKSNLIKIMVVLSALAIFAFLAYYFENFATSQAATKLVEDARVLEKAYQMYTSKTGTDLEAASDGSHAYFRSMSALLVDNGILKSIPSPPESAGAGNVSPEWDYAYMFAESAFLGNLGGTEVGDVAIYLPEISDEVCKAINEKFSGFGASIVPQGTIPANEKVFCKRYGGDRWNSMVYVLKVN